MCEYLLNGRLVCASVRLLGRGRPIIHMKIEHIVYMKKHFSYFRLRFSVRRKLEHGVGV